MHADTSAFKDELAAGVKGALEAQQAQVRAATVGGGTTGGTSAADAAAAEARKASALQAQILRDDLANMEVEAAQERAVAAETADIEKQYRAAVAAAAKESYAQILATVESEAIQERAIAAENAAAFKAAEAEKVAAAKAASDAVAKGNAAASKVGAAAVTAAKVAIGTSALATVGIGVAAVKSAFDLQIAVQKVINLSSGQLGLTASQVSAQVLAASRATGVAASDVAGAFYKIAAAGKPAKEAVDILNASAKSSAIGLGTATSVADELIAAINVYGDANLSAAKAANIFLATTQNSKFGPDELGTSIGRVLPLAHELGVSLQDLGGALAALSHTGLSADQAVTGLQAISSNLIAATKTTGNASKEFKALGLNAQNVITDIGTHGLVAALGEVNTALEKSGTSAKTTKAQYQDLATNLGISLQQAEQDFGKIDLGKLQKVFPNRKAFIAFLGLTDENNQAAQQAYQNVLTVRPETLDKAFLGFKGSVAGKISIGINAIKTDIISLGNQLLPTVAKVVQKIQDTIAQVKDPNSDLHKFLVTLGQDLKDIGTVAVPILQGMATAFVLVVKGAKPLLDILAFIAKTSGGKVFFEIAGGLFAMSAGVKLLTGAAGTINGLAAAFVGLRAAATETSLLTAIGPGGTVVGGIALIAGTAYLTTAALNHFDGATVSTKDRVNALRDALAPAVNKIKDLQGPTGVASAGLHHIATEALGLTRTLPGTQNSATNLAHILKDVLGLSADQTRAALVSLGFSVQDANSIIAGTDTSSAVAQYDNLTGAADAATAALIKTRDAALAAYNASVAAASAPPNPFAPAPGNVLNVLPGTPIATPPPVSGLTGGTGGGGGGGGGSKGPSAAQTAAANRAQNFADAAKQIVQSVQDLKSALGTDSADQIKSALASIDKAIAAAFKADRKTEPSSLVKLLKADNDRLLALAEQRDALTKEITDAQAFAAQTLTGAQGFGALSAVAQTVAAFNKSVTDLSRLHLVLPGDRLRKDNPVNDLQSALDARLAALVKFQKNIQTLIHEGLNAGSLQDLISGGAEQNGALAAALAAASPAQIAALNATQAQITATAKKLSANAGDVAAQAGIDAGKAVADGILQGLQDKNAALLKAMTALADALVKELKTKLGIKSPSQVMRALGVHAGTGLEHGILSTHGAIAAAAAGMSRAAVPRMESFPAQRVVGTSFGGAGAGPVVTHNRSIEVRSPITVNNWGNPDSAGASVGAAIGLLVRR